MKRVSHRRPQHSRRPKRLGQLRQRWHDFVCRVDWRLVRKIALITLLVVVLAQILFPGSRVLSQVKIGDKSYAFQSIDQLTDVIHNAFEQSSAKLVADDQTRSVTLLELGASIDASRLATEINDYSWWQRLIPFSIFFAGSSLTDLQPKFNETTLIEASNKLAADMTVEAKNGSITINDQNEIAIEPAQDAVSVESSSIQKAINQANFKIGSTEVKVENQSTKPDISNDVIQETKTKLLAMSHVKITITNSLTKGTTTPGDTDILGWLSIVNSSDITFDETAMADYLTNIAGDSVIAAGTTKIVMVNGKETSRTTGKDGRAVDVDPIVKQLEDALNNQQSAEITMNFKVTTPNIVYDRSYNHSQAALQAYIDHVTSSGTIQISVKQLTGSGWAASSRATDSVVSASTYKLFISLLLMKKIDAGTIHWSDIITDMPGVSSITVEQCLINTIHVSANNCAEYWLKKWGKTNINNELHGLGFSSATTFSASDAAHTSAADLQKLLIGLYNHSLFSVDNANRLLGLMKQQIYRSGIPKGSSGVVADKVGFLWAYLNDAAIVYHPKGTYVLVIMTNNQSWSKIAQITTKIEDIMYGTD